MLTKIISSLIENTATLISLNDLEKALELFLKEAALLLKAVDAEPKKAIASFQKVLDHIETLCILTKGSEELAFSLKMHEQVVFVLSELKKRSVLIEKDKELYFKLQACNNIFVMLAAFIPQRPCVIDKQLPAENILFNLNSWQYKSPPIHFQVIESFTRSRDMRFLLPLATFSKKNTEHIYVEFIRNLSKEILTKLSLNELCVYLFQSTENLLNMFAYDRQIFTLIYHTSYNIYEQILDRWTAEKVLMDTMLALKTAPFKALQIHRAGNLLKYFKMLS
ncbi:MAG: hypothetical protein AABX71_01705, partial [Nanoarchaeota archaeon]